jgi:diguanylate cyclase (GGDEF)-like protein
VIVVDRDGVVRFTNEAAERLLGMAPKRVEDLPEEIRLAQEGARDVSLSTGHVVETRNVETVWQHRPSCLITLHDCTDRYRAERAMTRLAAELTRANERLERLVGTDPLTEALNRRGIDAALETELARLRRTGDELAAILIDYDNFKAINESYGHAVGDATLRALTQSVRGALRTGDYLGRVGGDEFLVLLPDTGIHVGMAVADKLRRAIKSTTLPLDDRKLSLSASLAVAGVGAQVVSLEQVLAAANLALRQSKRSGKDRVSTSDPWVEAKGPGGPTPEIDLTSIELDTYLQGIHCLDSGAVVGYEALTRGPVGGLATPDDLFRAAFEYNALTALDLRALSASIRVRSLAHLRDGWFHVNLFPSTILNTPAGRILRLLDESGETNQLCLEISEQQFLGDPAYLAGPLAVLREEGVRIALDDVGYGRSSIEALLVLEPDVVKVDRSCVRGIDARPRERRRLERLLSIIRIGGALAIVEGVETEEELRVLRDIGVSHCQGYLWGEPRPAAAG